MEHQLLQGKRVLITHADAFMGPTLCDVLARHGATVLPSNDALTDTQAAAAVVSAAGHIVVLVANLA